MKKAYCDICGAECDFLGDYKNEHIFFSFSIGADEHDEDIMDAVDLVDICWDCRDQLGTLIKAMQQAKGKIPVNPKLMNGLIEIKEKVGELRELIELIEKFRQCQKKEKSKRKREKKRNERK